MSLDNPPIIKQMAYSLEDLMQLIVSERGDAIHLHDGKPPVLEIRGQLHRLEGPSLDSGEGEKMFRGIAPEEEIKQAADKGLSAFAFRFGKDSFFRIMAFQEGDSIRLELRRAL